MTQIGVVVVSYGRLQAAYELGVCVAGYGRALGHEVMTIVVDNLGESHGPLPGVQILELDNPGFGAAINSGVSELPDACEAVICMSHDVRIDRNSAELLLDRVLSGSADIAAPRLRIDEQTSFGLKVTWRNVTHAREPAAISAIDGAILVVARAAWRRLGGYRTDYFLYWEDTELGLRADKCGLRVDVVADAVASSSSAAGSPAHEYYTTRNAYLFRRDVRTPWFRLAMCYLAFRDGVIAVRRLGSPGHDLRTLGQLRLRGLVDGLKGRRGSRNLNYG